MKTFKIILINITIIATCYPFDIFVGGSSSLRKFDYAQYNFKGQRYYNNFVVGIEKALYVISKSYSVSTKIYYIKKGFSGKLILNYETYDGVVAHFTGDIYHAYISTGIFLKRVIPFLMPEISFIIGPRFDYAINHIEDYTGVEYSPETAGILGKNFNNTDIGLDIGLELSMRNFAISYIYSENFSNSYSTDLITIKNIAHQFIISSKIFDK